MRWSPGVAARRSGSMTGSGAFGLPSTSSKSGNGSLRTSLKVLASTASSEAMSASSILPSESRPAHRFSEDTQSAAVTGVPSCHLRPSRKVKVQVSLSGLVCQLSTICGLISPASFIANSVSKTCSAKVRVMFTVVACGSRIVTSDSRTTVSAFSARAACGWSSDAPASTKPPANAARRPRSRKRMSTPSNYGRQRSDFSRAWKMDKRRVRRAPCRPG